MTFKSKLSLLRADAGRSGARAKKKKQLVSAPTRVSLGKPPCILWSRPPDPIARSARFRLSDHACFLARADTLPWDAVDKIGELVKRKRCRRYQIRAARRRRREEEAMGQLVPAIDDDDDDVWPLSISSADRADVSAVSDRPPRGESTSRRGMSPDVAEPDDAVASDRPPSGESTLRDASPAMPEQTEEASAPDESDAGLVAPSIAGTSMPPPFNANITELVGPMRAAAALKLIDHLPTESDGVLWRVRRRVRRIVEQLAYLPILQTFEVLLYVRGDEPPPKPIILPDTPLLVLSLHEGHILDFVQLQSPAWAAGEEEQAALEAELLELARWQMAHMPVLPRKGEIHVGMSGRFYCLGVHDCYLKGSHNEVAEFRPRGPCRCSSKCSEAATLEAWRGRVQQARRVSGTFSGHMGNVMPTEESRQASLVENYFNSYAEARDVMDALTLEDQHGLCQSVENKVALGHADGGNHGQYNWLTFSAPTLVKRRLAADPTLDLGGWLALNELWLPFRPRLDIIFNSGALHCCIPHYSLVKYAADHEGMLREAGAYVEEGFADLELAAAYQSSIVGTTTFQQRAVTHKVLRAAEGQMCHRVLHGHVAAAATCPVPRTPEAAAAAKRDARTQELEMRARLRELDAGSCVRVVWESGEVRVGRVVEKPVVGAERCDRASDVGVRIRYEAHADRVMCERLGLMDWSLVRSCVSE
jgi:hypothetical protein